MVSTLSADGTLTVEVAPMTMWQPTGSEILVRVEAAPVNPSDLGLLFGMADTDQAEYRSDRIVARMPESMTRAMKGRHGIPTPMGNECAGTVLAAGDDPAALALVGKRVSCTSGTAFATHTLADARMAMVLPDEVTATEGASAFVNPMTALAFVETMKRDGFTGLVHTAAASNLGQMLVRLCAADAVPLVNITRSASQVALLQELGAQHALDSASPDFRKKLVEAVAATGAMMAFDAIGGGNLVSLIIGAMESAAKRRSPEGSFTLYGSNVPKRVYIYGALDLSPTTLHRGLDFQWQLGGWVLPSFLASAGPQVAAKMRARVQAELKTTFASHYKAEVDLRGMLRRDAVAEYNARRTGSKYLLRPNP